MLSSSIEFFKVSKTLHILHRRRKVEEPPMNSAPKEVSDSGSSDDEPLSTIRNTEAKKYADYILQRNESIKRKADNEVLQQLKAEKKQLEERLLAEKKRSHSLEVEHKRRQETLEKERKERARQVEAEEKEKLEVERIERQRLEAAKREVAEKKERELVEAKREKERMEAEKKKRERADAEMRAQQHKTEKEKAEKELFENWDPHTPEGVESEREEWMHVLSTSEDPQMTSLPDGSDVRKVRVVMQVFP